MNSRVRHLTFPSVAAFAVILYVLCVFCEPAGAAERVTVNFDALRQQEAPQAVGWIQLAGTYLNYPVVRGEDNSFYLTHLPNGRESDSGSIFMDFRSAPDFTDKNTLIHGHRMKSGAMFGTLKSYILQEYYEKHPVVSIYTPQGNYDVLLFAGYTFDTTAETLPISFDDAEAFESYVRSSRDRSMFRADVEVGADDLLVTLVTCDTDYDEGRLALIGKLLK